MDLFFCTLDEETPLRAAFAATCLERWRAETVCRWSITPSILNCTPFEFQRQRRIFAENLARGEIYILADGDCLLGPESPIPQALSLMAKYPDFGILSLMPENCTIVPWTPENYAPILTDEVMEHVSVGGIRFCRKGILGDWPAQNGPGYDGIHSEAIRKAGFRVGYARNLLYNHLGERFSSVW